MCFSPIKLISIGTDSNSFIPVNFFHIGAECNFSEFTDLNQILKNNTYFISIIVSNGHINTIDLTICVEKNKIMIVSKKKDNRYVRMRHGISYPIEDIVVWMSDNDEHKNIS